jgi:uncharacterized membrane protein YcaP (DUF421 family)
MNDHLAVAATAAALYATAFFLVRLAGRRTVSQLSAFDALVTIALGSIMAGSILGDPPSYTRGAAAIVTLLTLQVAVGAARQRVPRLRRLLDYAPAVVFEDGAERLGTHPLGAQLTSDEVSGALRAAGVTDRSEVEVVVLEADGRFSVIKRR